MRKRIRTPVIDECRLEGMLQEISGLEALRISHDAKILLPDDSTIDQHLQIVHALLDSHDATAVRGRFLIGNAVNAMCFKHGDKKAVIRDNFSEHDWNRISKFARVAAAWGWRPDLTWGWSFYDETAKLKRKDQVKVLAKWERGGYTVKHFRSDSEIINPTSDISKHDPTVPNPTYSPNTKYVGSELDQAVRNAPTREDAVRLRELADQRVLDFDQDDTDQFEE